MAVQCVACCGVRKPVPVNVIGAISTVKLYNVFKLLSASPKTEV